MTSSFDALANDNAASTNPPATNTSTEAVVDFEGQKLTPEEVIKQLNRLKDKDNFIEQLKAERAEDRKTMQELIETVKKSSTVDDLLKRPEAGKAKEVDVDDLAQKVFDRVSGKAKESAEQAKADANFSLVVDELTKQYGKGNVAGKVQEIASANGIEDPTAFAKKYPAVFLKMFGTKAPTLPASINGTRQAPHSVEAGKTDPLKLLSAKGTKERVDLFRQLYKELSSN